jgi:Coenzyme PQQ synthesis protein D (PqqD)
LFVADRVSVNYSILYSLRLPEFYAELCHSRRPMKAQISRTSTLVAAKDQVSCDLAGEAVILNLKSGMYYGLDSVGARIWNLIQEPKTVSAVLDTLLEEYDVEPDRCESDLFILLNDLAGRDLLEIKTETNGVAK